MPGRLYCLLRRAAVVAKSIVRFDPEALRQASTVENIERAHATNFAANARFSSYPTEGDDAERKTSAPAKLKSRKDSLAGLTKEERLAKRKASMQAGDSWEDLHGTKDRPPKQFEREEQRLKYEALEAAREAERATAAGAGPSSYGDVDIEQPAVAGERGEVKQRV